MLLGAVAGALPAREDLVLALAVIAAFVAATAVVFAARGDRGPLPV